MNSNNSSEPVFTTDEDRSFFMVEFPVHHLFKQVTPHVTPHVIELLSVLKGEMERRQIQEILGLKDRHYFRDTYLVPAIDAGAIEMTIPNKPRSRNQKYRLTPIGLMILKGADK
jgi:ATP-dependent DNA helicase RecG